MEEKLVQAQLQEGCASVTREALLVQIDS
jgi:hypothetical protein